MAWYPGVQGGHAVADVLLGDANPSGRAPMSFPASIEDLQAFPRMALDVTYDRYHGYQRLDKNGVAPFIPFGFGLSYTMFAYDSLTANTRSVGQDGVVTLRLSLSNTGTRAGVETVQVYAGAVSPTVDLPVRKLVGFTQARLEAGDSTTIELEVPVRELAYYEEGEGWVVEPGLYKLEVGPNVGDLPTSVEVQVR